MVRMKQLWEMFPLPAQLKLVWSRLTSNRLTTFYFVLSVTHCFIQVVFQLAAYSINFKATEFLTQLQISAGLASQNFTLLSPDRKTLQSCWAIPGSTEAPACKILWAAPGLFEDGLSPDDFGILDPITTITPGVQLPPGREEADREDDDSDDDDDDDAASDASSDDGEEESDDESDDDDEDEPARSAGASVVGFRSTVSPTRAMSTVVVTRTIISGSVTATGQTIRKARRSTSPSHTLAKRAVFITPITGRTETDPNNFTITALQISGLSGGVEGNHSIDDHSADVVQVTAECVAVLSWPLQALRNTKREDVVFIGFQIWVFGMCIVALLNESIPHIIAALFTHVLATMWSGFQLNHTANFRKNFAALTVNGACRGVNLLPGYWKERASAEIPVLVLNCIALIASGVLSWRLIKLFGWATFKRVGASLKINRIYKIVLTMSIVLQLSLFFLVTAIALWIDQLYNGSIGKFATHGTAYRVIATVLLLLLVPWLALGWFGVRREHNGLTYSFLGLSILFLIQWGSSFASATWRLTFLNWYFFAIMDVVAAGLTLLAFFLGVICQRNFGEQLSKYLESQEPLEGEDFQRVTSWDQEKNPRRSDSSKDEPVAFPTTDAVPTYSVIFGKRKPVPETVQPLPAAVTIQRDGSVSSDSNSIQSSAHFRVAPHGHKRWESTSSFGNSGPVPADPYANITIAGLPARHSTASSDSFWDKYSFTSTAPSVPGGQQHSSGAAVQGAPIAGPVHGIQKRWIIE